MNFVEDILILAISGETEIADLPFVAKAHDVGGFEVSMDDTLSHHVFVASNNLFHDVDCSVFGNAFLELYQLLQIAVRAILKGQVVKCFGFEHIHALDNVRMPQRHHNLHLHVQQS